MATEKQIEPNDYENVIRSAEPTDEDTIGFHYSGNEPFFNLAGKLKAEPSLADIDKTRLRLIFRRWFELFGNQICDFEGEIVEFTFAQAYTEFLEAWDKRKYGGNMGQAIERAKEANYQIPELIDMPGEDIAFFARLCYELSRPSSLFYLSCGEAAKITGKDSRQVGRNFNGLVSLGILEVVEKGQRWQKGKKAKATKYKYIGKNPKIAHFN